jgi:hypothetical protein
MAMLISRFLARWTKRRQERPIVAKTVQLALPHRVDLPLRERSRGGVALPANISGAHMGTGKF